MPGKTILEVIAALNKRLWSRSGFITSHLAAFLTCLGCREWVLWHDNVCFEPCSDSSLVRNCACSESDTHPLLQAHLLLTGMHVLSGAARQQMRPSKVPSPEQDTPAARTVAAARPQLTAAAATARAVPAPQQGLLPGLARDLGRQAPHPPGRVRDPHSRSRAGRQRPRRMLLTRHSQAGRLQAQAWKLGLSTVAAKWVPGAPTRGLAAGC